MDIATSKCFFLRGNNSVAIETTPNLRCKSDNVLYFVRCLSRRYIHAWPSLYTCLVISVSTPCHLCIHALPSLYPRLSVAVSTLCIRFFLNNANPRIRHHYSHALPSLYPCLVVSVSTPSRRCIHALYKF